MASADTTPSALTDALEIFYAPSDVFERRKLEPSFGLPLIILVLAIGILFFVSRGAMDPIFEAEFKRGIAQAMKQNPQLTPEMAETVQGDVQEVHAAYRDWLCVLRAVTRRRRLVACW